MSALKIGDRVRIAAPSSQLFMHEGEVVGIEFRNKVLYGYNVRLDGINQHGLYAGDALELLASPGPVSHPAHYTTHPSGVECIQITEHMGFNLGNALKYIWRCDLKQDAIEDLKKARWYIDREIARREATR